MVLRTLDGTFWYVTYNILMITWFSQEYCSNITTKRQKDDHAGLKQANSLSG